MPRLAALIENWRCRRAERKLRRTDRWEHIVAFRQDLRIKDLEEQVRRLESTNRIQELELKLLAEVHVTDVDRWRNAVSAGAVAPIKDQ